MCAKTYCLIPYLGGFLPLFKYFPEHSNQTNKNIYVFVYKPEIIFNIVAMINTVRCQGTACYTLQEYLVNSAYDFRGYLSMSLFSK